MKNLTSYFFKTSIIFSLLLFSSINSFGQTIDELLEQASTQYDEMAFEKMLETAEKILTINPNHPKGHNYKGIYFDVKGDYENAKIQYKKAASLDEKYDSPWGNLVTLYIYESDFESAIQHAKKYCSLKPEEADHWTTQAFAFFYAEKMDSTIFYANKAIALDKKETGAYTYKAFALSRLNQKEKAYATLDEMVKNVPTTKSYRVRGDFKFDYGEYDDAFNDFNKSLKENPKNNYSLEGRSEIFFYRNDFEKSKADALRALEEDSTSVRAIYFLGWDEFYLGNFDEALKSAQYGVDRNLTDYNFNYLLGEYYFKMENFDKAKEALTLAADFAESSASVFISKAMATTLSHTDKKDIKKVGDSYKFSQINSNNTKQLDEWTTDPNHKYYFEKLLKKYNTDYTSLGFDEYFMFYYGFSNQDSYTPYSMGQAVKALQLDSLFNAGKQKEVATLCEELLKENIFELEVYFYAASAFYDLNDFKKYEEYVFKGNMFMRSILATGDGETKENAWVVICVSDEYDILKYLDLRSKGQSLYHENEHSYDGLTIYDGDENEENDVSKYFNIEKSFNHLGKSLNEKEDKKEKKKKRKKRRKNKKKKKG